MYSCGMPRISPATRRPPLMQSSIAYSSATRTGLLSGTRFPIIAMRTLFVGYTSAAPMRLQFAISPYGLMANCNLIGAALVYPTKSVRIAMMGNLVPLNNPVRVAEEYAMLDCMSGGRLVAGLMRGIPHEYIAYNIPPDASWSRQREAIALILKAWTEPEPFGWEGEHFQFRQVSIWPRPLQKPHPPLVVSASSLESARFAGEMRATMGMVLISDLALARECIQVYLSLI